MILNGEEVTEIQISRCDGHLYNILDWDVSDMPIEHIAHNLANINRYGGAQPRPVSVGLHSVMVSYLVNDALAYEALMHDVTEAFVGDMMHPIKAHCQDFKAIEEAVRQQVIKNYSIPRVESWQVKNADLRARELECLYRRGAMSSLATAILGVLNMTTKENQVCNFFLAQDFTPNQVAEMFLARYETSRALAQNWS